MSEYQYYEFQAVDRSLDQREMAELRALSTRATITPTRFVNHYEWGDFRGDPAKLVERYFDAFVYIANWGTHEFKLRLPARLLDLATVSRYSAAYAAEARQAGDVVILEFSSEDEGGDWDDDGSGWMASLLPLRADLANGDLRCLYLAWLSSIYGGEPDDDAAECSGGAFEFGGEAFEPDEGDVEPEGGVAEVNEDAVEPPVPPGLGTLSAALRSFADFMRVDDDLIAVAAEASAPLEVATPSCEELARQIAALPDAEKNDMLVRLAAERNPHLGAELLRRLRLPHASAGEPGGVEPAGGRTMGQLVAAAGARRRERRRAEAERKARERAQRAREEAATRAAYLDRLAPREEEAWRQVDSLADVKRAKEYDQAVQLLVDLRDLYARSGRSEAFDARMRDVRERHGRKPSLIDRVDRARLGPRTVVEPADR